MRCLLDTHILLWSLLEPARLETSVRRALEDTDNELWISPISLWEICLLVEKGRVTVVGDDPVAWIRGVLSKTPLKEASMTGEVALRSRTVDLAHQDPADRFLAATALVYDLVLLTADERLLSSSQLNVLR